MNTNKKKIPKYNNATKQMLGFGIIVRKDINGKDIKVGDVVKITRPYMDFETNEIKVKIEETSWIGEVRLLLSKGILIWANNVYIKAPITDNSRNKWSWELVNSNALIE